MASTITYMAKHQAKAKCLEAKVKATLASSQIASTVSQMLTMTLISAVPVIYANTRMTLLRFAITFSLLLLLLLFLLLLITRGVCDVSTKP